MRSCLCHFNSCTFPRSFWDAVWHQSGSERDSPPPRHHINHQFCLFERLVGMRERWRDEQREEGKETVIISLSEKYKVQGEVSAVQITPLCFAVINTEYVSLLHIHVQRLFPWLLFFFFYSPQAPASLPLRSSPLCGTTGKGREGLEKFNGLSERQAGKCKSLLLRWENPLSVI